MSRDESKTRVELIDPALHSRGWTEGLIRRERTPGATIVLDGTPHARKGRSDYLLCLPAVGGTQPLPVAVIEAKAEDKLAELGLQQGKNYQRRFNVPFVYSTNGHLYAEYGDDTRRIETSLPLATFPTPSELQQRYEKLKGFKLHAPEAKPLFMSYKGGEAARYYFQDAAIRATIEKIAAQGEKSNRVLLSLATGTGKTVIATQLLYKLAQAGQLRRALFVCDRDELRTQALTKLQGMFGDNAQMVTTSDAARNARILVASYQTLNITGEDDEPRFWRDNYPPGHFSHIIIDEAHRSAWGRWSVILTDNPEAVHIGLTATPRKLKGSAKTEAAKQDEAITAHNIDYFGDPVYEYTLGAGQEDGYLAACEVVRRTVDIDLDDITKEDISNRSATDPYTGRLVRPDELESSYSAKEYETKLMLPDRVQAMAGDLFDLLLQTGGPEQKTIIFCARDTHATYVQIALNNLYEEWCETEGRMPKDWFAFQCTGNPDLRPPARELIAEMKGSRSSHFVATTVDLLSTGVDIPNLENVVFFRYIESPISFYQMVGRGSRTGEPRGSKPLFRLYDYTNATRLFGEEFETQATPSGTSDGGGEGGATPTRPRPQVIKVEGFTVQVEGDGRSILVERDGKEVLVPLEEYKEQLAASLEEHAASLDDLRLAWVAPGERRKLLDELPGGEGAVRLVRKLDDQDECDLYDVLAELTYGVVARSRSERVAGFSYKNKLWLQALPEATGAVLSAIAGQFERGGIEELETESVFDEETVLDAGGFDALLKAREEPQELIQETKVRILAA
jgi:type I restriction enzyme R subunit